MRIDKVPGNLIIITTKHTFFMRTIVLIALTFLCSATFYAQQAVAVSYDHSSENDDWTATENEYLGKIAIRNLRSLNSHDLDYSPLLYKNGLVFTSTRKYEGHRKRWFKSCKKQYSYLFFSKRNNRGDYLKPKPLEGSINGRYHEGAASFNTEGTVMFFSRNNRFKNQFGKYDLKIYTATNRNGNWTNTQEIKAINGDDFTACHPSISKDGKRLYFSSNRNGGFGGMDIYVSHLVDGEWQHPINLGPEINSEGNEIFPFIDEYDVLYFSSDGLKGNGGLDIFTSFRTSTDASETWSPATNLGLPFNSSKDDFGFSIYKNGQEGFFTSTRAGGKGHDDIYNWRKQYIPQAQAE